MNTSLGFPVKQGEVVYTVQDIKVVIAIDPASLARTRTALNAISAMLGIAPAGPIIEGSLVEPIIDQGRLIE